MKRENKFTSTVSSKLNRAAFEFLTMTFFEIFHSNKIKRATANLQFKISQRNTISCEI